MNIKQVARGAFFLNTLLFGSYYAISKEVLGRVDPIVFSFCEMMTLVPPALIILVWSRRHMTRQAVKNGFILGSCLCLGLFMLSVALRYNSATGTAFFPALNGLLAALFTWLFLRRPINKATWFAGIVSVVGAFLLMANADMGGIRGSLIAFIGGLFCTMYIFLADHVLVNDTKKDPAAYLPLFAIELLTMALWGNLIALLFGDWTMVHLELPKDALIILYIGLGTVCLPTLITVLLQKHISPVTVSFISILEPLLGALVAYLYLHEVLPLDGYIGGGLIVAGVLIHTWGSLERIGTSSAQTQLRQGLEQSLQRFYASRVALLLYPLLCSGIGAYIVSRLGGFPPPVWRDLFQSAPQIPTMIQQGQATVVCILVAQSLSWLIAWSSLLLMGGIATYHALEMLFIAVGWSKLNPYTQSATIAARVGASSTLTPSYTDWPYQATVGRGTRPLHNLEAGKHFTPTAGLLQIEAFAVPTQEEQEAAARISQISSAQTQPHPALGPVGSDQPLEIDVRLLRQMGYTPYSVSARPAKRKRDTLQQRRLQRRIRLAHAESPKVTGPLSDELRAAIERQESCASDSRGNSYLYWDEFSHSGGGWADSNHGERTEQ